MSAAELVIMVDDSRDGAGNVVEFSCPVCSLRGSTPIDERGTRLLAAAGIQVTMAPRPDLEAPAGPSRPHDSRW